MKKQLQPVTIRREGTRRRVLRIVGWFGLVFWGMIAMVGIADMIRGYKTAEVNGETVEKALEAVDYAAPIVCAALAALHGWMLVSARRAKQRMEDFRLFSAFFSTQPEEKSISRLAASLNRPLDATMKQMQALCKRGYFDGYIDYRQQCVRFYGDAPGPQMKVACCPGCGAKTAIADQGGVCRYCGSPLSHLP